MDYNLLIKRLRAHKIKTDFGRFKPDICEKAATAIETLLAERDALRTQQAQLDRSRWEGCEWCTGFCPEVTGDPHWNYKFCPMCGRPLTEEAWAELERRINGGTTD